MEKKIQQVIEDEINSGSLAGASIYIVKDGKELMQQTYGYARLEDKKVMSRDTIFRIYSMTKPITAVATMMLWERGLLDLTDPISKYLDGFKNQVVDDDGELKEVEQEVTIQHLLNMTSGLVYPDQETLSGKKMEEVFGEEIKRMQEGKPWNTVEFCNEIGKVPLAFQPGSKWQYGTSADILGGVIEVVTKKRLGDFLKEELFLPLGMMDTDFYVPDEKYDRLATIYQYKEEQQSCLEAYNGVNLAIFDINKKPAFEAAGAGLTSTIDDYMKFAQMLLNDGTYNGKQFLGRKTVDYLHKNQLTKEQLVYMNWPQLRGYGYGNLMRVLMNEVTAMTNVSVGEYGWDGWAGTYMMIDPVENLVLLCFIQRIDKDPEPMRRKIRSIVYGNL